MVYSITKQDMMNTAKIYKLECRDVKVTEIYIGATANMRVRRCKHKSACTKIGGRDYNCRVYQYIRENGGFQNWQMLWVADIEYPVDRIDIKRATEARYIRELGATLNSEIPGRTGEQYRQDHKVRINERDNAKTECECGGKYTHSHKARHFKTAKHKKYLDNLE